MPVNRTAKHLERLVALLLAVMLAMAPLLGCSGETDRDALSSMGSVYYEKDALDAKDDASRGDDGSGQTGLASLQEHDFDLGQIPAYTGGPYTVVADNAPSFGAVDLDAPEEDYAPLDSLGRCGTAFAIVSRSTMPSERRGVIGMVKPSGWHTVRYDDLIADRYLYNRCHLIGYQLTAENANEENLITGTRYLNIEGMLPFENEIADYVERTGNRVLYRVTPVFVDDELVARGVHMEAYSVEDDGAGVCFNVFCYNVQPGIDIDYATGESWRASAEAAYDDMTGDGAGASAETTRGYVVNVNTGKFHLPGCRSVGQMKDSNKREVTAMRSEMIDRGYSPCGNCNP